MRLILGLWRFTSFSVRGKKSGVCVSVIRNLLCEKVKRQAEDGMFSVH